MCVEARRSDTIYLAYKYLSFIIIGNNERGRDPTALLAVRIYTWRYIRKLLRYDPKEYSPAKLSYARIRYLNNLYATDLLS